METGIVVDNFDPLYKGRCKVRIIGKHTEKVGGLYTILDDDLPWAKPAPTSSSSGGFSVPSVGQRVSVEYIDSYNIIYHGVVENKATVKKFLIDNAEECDNIKILLFEGISGSDNGGDYAKIYYIPGDGLIIECNGNKVTLPKYNNMEIKTKTGVGIEIDSLTNDVTISTDANINLNAKNVNLCDGDEKIPLGSRLMEVFNTHTHFCPGGSTNPPTEKLRPTDFSKNITIK